MSKIRKNDTVQILLGKDNGKTGKVLRVDGKKEKVWVEGANLVKRHVRSQQGIEGGIIDLPKPLKVSNVALVCPNCKKATRVGFKIEGTTKSRICRKCKKEIAVAS